jgi:hypothetical protein
MWSGHSCPLLLTSDLPLTFDLPLTSDLPLPLILIFARDSDFARDTPLGELSRKERSDETGQFVGKRAGSAAAVAQEGAKRRP